MNAHTTDPTAARPWTGHIKHTEDSVWNDYADWKAWFESRLMDYHAPQEAEAVQQWCDDMDESTRVGLYSMMCELAEPTSARERDEPLLELAHYREVMAKLVSALDQVEAELGGRPDNVWFPIHVRLHVQDAIKFARARTTQ